MIDAKLLAPYARAVTNSKDWPKVVKARFIQPGLVRYDDPNGLSGTILVQRPALNKMLQTYVGKPVIDEVHKDAKPENFKEIADGVVIRAWTDVNDGWDWCEFLVWDDATLRHCYDPNYHVSCAYDPTSVDRNGGKHNNVDYDGEFMDGVYTHLAIVKDPRYEGAKIVTNSKGGNSMLNLLKIFKKETVENSVEVNPAEAYLEVDGEKVTIENAIKIVKAENAKAKAANGAMKDDDMIEIDGKPYSGKDIRNAIKNAQEKGEKAGDQDEDVEKEKKQGKKDSEEAKNALCSKHDEADCAKCSKEAKNALEPKEEKGKHLNEFREVAEVRNNEPGLPSINTMTERLAAGKARYGKTKEVA